MLNVVYRIYGVHEGREKDSYVGAFCSVAEAEAEIANLMAREMHGQNWAKQYHNQGFIIREVVVQTDFKIPSRPKPRDRYFVRGACKENQSGTWPSTIVEVFRRADPGGEATKVCEYERNHALLNTFEPFRQGDRELALISPQYTGTSVLDLTTGDVIAAELVTSTGFCPVGFYVPDWWDLHDGSVIPGSEYWNADHEWPLGEFGFVWGCEWGDDSSWKVQLLDLTEIQSGRIRRDERFGYVELATDGFRSPCFEPEFGVMPKGSTQPRFIKLERREGKTTVTFSVEMGFDLDAGHPTEWQRLRIANFE
ncbi:MAG: hypothetical protein JNK57_14545 [Planctomycetaceae bacterium]|nr:hypothetical protein [Planctomycetaceae bacterium]